MKTKFQYLNFRMVIVLIASLVIPSSSYAKVKIGNLYYNLDSSTNTAEVTDSNSSTQTNYVSGDLIIPETIEYNSQEYSVTSIGVEALWSCTKLKTVIIPTSVTSIKHGAFGFCTSLTSVSIPNSVTSIESSAFNFCSQLTSVTIPNSVTSIGNGAFKDCSSLTSITIPNSVTSIEDYTFYNCSGLTSVTIPNSVTSIEGYAFTNCSSLTSVEIPNSVTSIGYDAFYGCSGLTSVTIGNSVTSIGEWAFYGCSSLNNIVYNIGKTIIELPSDFFDENIYNNSTLTISFSEQPFEIFLKECWKKFKNIQFQQNGILYLPVLYFNGINSENAYYSDEIGCLVKKGESIKINASNDIIKAFHLNHDITNQLLSNGGYSFLPSEKLENNIISGSSGGQDKMVRLSEAGSLFNTLGLENIQNIDSLTIFGNINGTDVMTLNRMISLKKLDLHHTNIVDGGATYRDNLKTNNDVINSYFFQDLKDIEQIILPATLHQINSYAFSSCSKLKSISIPASVNIIESNVFKDCKSLKTFILEKGSSPINLGYGDALKSMLSSCPLESIFIGRQIGYMTSSSSNISPFSGKTTIVSAIVDKKGDVENYLFDGCSNLQNLIIGDEVTSIYDYAFRNCNSLKKVILPTKLLWIGSYAFSNCSSLNEIVIPDGVTALPSDCFSGCTSLEKLMLGSGMKSINDYAFTNCSAITQLRSLAPLPPVITSTVFKAVNKDECQLIVTKGNLVYYWLDPVWKEFINMSDTILCLSPLPTLKYGDAPINLTEFAPAGVTLTYETSNPEVAQIDGSMLSIVGAGVATIGALYDVDDTPMEIIGQMRQFFVDKADLTLAAESYTIEAGMPIPQFTMSADGLCYDDELEDVGELPEFYCEADENSEPGEYPIYLVGGESNNYNLNLVAGTLKIVEKSDNTSIDAFFDSESADDRVKVFNLNGVLVFEGLKDDINLSAGVYIVITESSKTYKIVK